ncbi:MAG: aldehyde dehydrogenase family protein [Smithella sp.]
MDRYQLFIDGKFCDPEKGKYRYTYDPCTELPIAEVPVAETADAKRAIEAARKAFDSRSWSGMPVKERAKRLYRLLDIVKEHEEEFMKLEAMDGGSTIKKTSMMDIPVGMEHMRLLIEAAERIPSYEPLPWIDFPSVSWNFVNREPIGVCAGIIPWNFPFMMLIWKVTPALAMGNTVILKPASDTPLTALLFARCVAEADIPPGVFNLIIGSGSTVGAELCLSPLVDKIAFTGSTEVGREVMKMGAETIKKVTLELGGKSPSLVLEDADFSVAVDGCLFGTFFHQGQVCESGTRCFVPESIYDEFVGRMLAKIKKGIVLGDTMDFETTMGPVVSKSQYDTVMSYIEIGKKEGAELLCGGKRPAHMEKGHFIEPTIFGNVKNEMRIAREEIFGPVLSVIKYKSLLDAIRQANDNIYGLAGAVWSSDIQKAIEVAKQLRTGTVWINDYHLLNALAPFGGYKQSGVGRELGTYGLKEYTQAKHIHVDLGTKRETKFWFDYIFND